jgi:hypothetical protein
MRYLIPLGYSLAFVSIILPAISVASEVTLQAVAPTPQRYALMGVSFETPVSFSAPTAMGENGVAVVYPANSVPGEHELMVSLISLPPMSDVLGGLSDQELRSWLRFTEVDGPLSAAPGRIERRILGRRVRGEVFYHQTPRPLHQELYLMRLQGGRRLAIIFEADDHVPLPMIEQVFSHVAATAQELAPRSREWKRSFEWWKHR